MRSKRAMLLLILWLGGIGAGVGCTGNLVQLIDDLIAGVVGVLESGDPALRRFQSAEELKDYFNDQLVRDERRFGRDVGIIDLVFDEADVVGSAPLGAAPAAGDGVADSTGAVQEDASAPFSQTTIQEVGVDEADVVKTDGEYLYILTGEHLRIVRAEGGENLAELGSVDLGGFSRGLYVVGDLAVALTQPIVGAIDIKTSPPVILEDIEPLEPPTSDDDGQTDPDAQPTISPQIAPDIAIFPVYRPRIEVAFIDVSDRSNPSVVSSTVFDGSLVSSRLIDQQLHVVLANHSDVYRAAASAGEQPETFSEFALEFFLPDFVSRTGAGEEIKSGEIVDWPNVLRPSDPDGVGLVYIISIDLASPEKFESVAVVADPGLVYASTSAIYVTDTEFDFSFRVRETTDIYKFALGDGRAELVAVGSVPGRVLNQYSMSEHNGFLRVATTTRNGPTATNEFAAGPSNNVFVLEQREDLLEVVGSIAGIAPGEEIRSARFLGDRGFLVTFERTDPFFTIDLSNPVNPRIVGELMIPGFSTFLTPIDDDHLLAVGEYIPEDGPLFSQGVQISVFDVSDFANPRRNANVIIGDQSTFSEAVHDPKAFAYYPERGMVALPVSQYGFMDVLEDDSGEVVSQQFFGLYIFNLNDAMVLSEVGRIETVLGSGFFGGPSYTRGVFIGDDIYAVTDRVVVQAELDDVANTQTRLELPSPFEEGDVVILEGDAGASSGDDRESASQEE